MPVSFFMLDYTGITTRVHGICHFHFPDRVTTHNSGGVHGACLFLFPDRGQNS